MLGVFYIILQVQLRKLHKIIKIAVNCIIAFLQKKITYFLKKHWLNNKVSWTINVSCSSIKYDMMNISINRCHILDIIIKDHKKALLKCFNNVAIKSVTIAPTRPPTPEGSIKELGSCGLKFFGYNLGYKHRHPFPLLNYIMIPLFWPFCIGYYKSHIFQLESLKTIWNKRMIKLQYVICGLTFIQFSIQSLWQNLLLLLWLTLILLTVLKKPNYVELNYLWFKQLNKMSIQNKSKIMLTMDGSLKNDVVI